MFGWLRGHDDRFQPLFIEAGQNLRQASLLFVELVDSQTVAQRRDHAIRLKALEHRGDALTRSIFEALNATFLTPLDREDIRDLAHGLDDTLDDIEAAGKALVQFRVEGTTDELRRLADLVRSACTEIEVLCSLVWNRAGFPDGEVHLIEISRLENEADTVFDAVIERLFADQDGHTALDVMKWKEIYERIEAGMNRSKSVASVVGNIIAKNA